MHVEHTPQQRAAAVSDAQNENDRETGMATHRRERMRQAERQVTTFANHFIRARGNFTICVLQCRILPYRFRRMRLPASTKLRFHLALYAAFLGRGRRQFKQVSKEPLRLKGSLPKGL